MRKAIGIAAVLVVIAAIVVVIVAVGGGPTPYQVQARFNNAGLAVSGEQVRIAGANVGTVGSLTVTKNNLASVTLDITNRDFTPWYANATCTIRPQSLIGERYVDCEPGSSSNAKLQRINSGPDSGQYVLPVNRTSSPIDTDIVANISQDSVRQSLSLILNELGTGLAARGSDLNSVILRANPALAQTQKVLQILGTQDKTLAELATSASKVLGPLAKSRKQLADFVGKANTVAAATASQKQQLAQSIALLPNFLTELKPLMTKLGHLANNGTPDLKALGASAGSLNKAMTELTPFASKAKIALQNLGSAAQQSEASLEGTLPLVQELLRVGRAAKPSSALLDKLAVSLQKSGGIQQLMGLLFYAAGASNGYNEDGHYARIAPIANSCVAYARTPTPGCSANFAGATAAAAAAGTTQTPKEVKAEARAASRFIWQPTSSGGSTGTSDAGTTTSGDLKTDEAATAKIAEQAVKQTSGGKRPSNATLSGLLRYLMGSGS